jgi:hypothetical protein
VKVNDMTIQRVLAQTSNCAMSKPFGVTQISTIRLILEPVMVLARNVRGAQSLQVLPSTKNVGF